MRLLTGILFVFFSISIACAPQLSQAQPVDRQAVKVNVNEKNTKPYRILTTGKQVTIKSSKTIKSVMVWTSGGNRIVEDKNVNASSYNFRITVNEKIFFIMVQLADGKTYSEKLGVQ